MTVPQAERSAVPPGPPPTGPQTFTDSGSPCGDQPAKTAIHAHGFRRAGGRSLPDIGASCRRRWRQRSVWWSTSETLNNRADREHPPGTVKEEAADRFALTGG
jgi:hypothetical protein